MGTVVYCHPGIQHKTHAELHIQVQSKAYFQIWVFRYEFLDVGRDSLWQSTKNCQDQLLTKISSKSGVLLQGHPWKQGQCLFSRAFKVYYQKAKRSLNFFLLRDVLLYMLFLPVLVQLIILLMIQLI